MSDKQDQQTWTLTLNTGAVMPAFGLGTWLSPKGTVGAAVEEAVRAGYRHIDCAHIYGNEDEIGHALQKLFQEGVVKREELFITSKLWNTEHDTEDAVPACELTLKNLQLDYLDLYLVHWPRGLKKGTQLGAIKDDDIIDPTEENIRATWSGMEKVAEKGLARAVGISNYTITQIELLLKHAKVVPAVNQVENHPYLQQPLLKKYCNSKGIVLEAYSPLGNPARPFVVAEDPVVMEDPAIKELAAKHSVSAAQICIAFQLFRGLSVIPKTVTKERVHQNLAATKVKLTQEDMERLYANNRNVRYVRLFMVKKGQSQEDYWDIERDAKFMGAS